ncbi:hypothetical protein [Actinoplanes friuliensis]|jgi:hypothetical protein|uniref:Uncharacterized protein n=1 Tax=Actinoplanes friuliensis DSM 7358 TaxID=1246995 RepID=U5W0M2_9ACTN|nr:hypothetical protein [Actinoplanes friuliensis]AGZ42783.1 hypothetical protein AFR_22565 [Actinoplanes friuliensis DSM 7358]
MSAYTVLLRLYPSDHPRDEMLGVLEENGRPWWREAPSLIAGAVRARTGEGQPPSLRWLYAARAAALMLLVAGTTTPLIDLHYGVELRTGMTVATWICAGLAAVAVMAGVRLVALGLTAAALVLSGMDQISTVAIAGYTLAAVLLLLPGRRLRVLNPLPVLLALSWSLDYTLPAVLRTALVVAVILWTVIDERILLAAGLALFAGLITASTEVAEVGDTRGLLIMAAWHLALPATLVAIAALLTQRRTRFLG